jgi:hypothetical protein
MSDTDDSRDGTETDWLANSGYGYGFGYTKEQALAAMMAHIKPVEEGTIRVSLVEHVGEAEVGMAGWDVEEFVDGEAVEIPAEEADRLRDAAIEETGAVEDALHAAETIQEYGETE